MVSIALLWIRYPWRFYGCGVRGVAMDTVSMALLSRPRSGSFCVKGRRRVAWTRSPMFGPICVSTCCPCRHVRTRWRSRDWEHNVDNQNANFIVLTILFFLIRQRSRVLHRVWRRRPFHLWRRRHNMTSKCEWWNQNTKYEIKMTASFLVCILPGRLRRQRTVLVFVFHVLRRFARVREDFLFCCPWVNPWPILFRSN